MALDRIQLEAALERAADLDSEIADRLSLDVDAVARVGTELGISPTSLTQALAEQIAGQATTLSTSAIVPGGRDNVLADLATYLRLRGLVATGSGVWEQRDGWWPDLYRFISITPVAVAAGVAGGPGESTRVTLTAGLDRIWRVHLMAGILGFLAVVLLTVPVLSFRNVLAAGLVATLVLVTIRLAYQRRRQGIAWRLEGALEEIARPSYQLQPW